MLAKAARVNRSLWSRLRCELSESAHTSRARSKRFISDPSENTLMALEIRTK